MATKRNYKLQSIYRRGEFVAWLFLLTCVLFPSPFKVKRFFPDRPYSISLGAHACALDDVTCNLFLFYHSFLYILSSSWYSYSSNHCRMKKPTDTVRIFRPRSSSSLDIDQQQSNKQRNNEKRKETETHRRSLT